MLRFFFIIYILLVFQLVGHAHKPQYIDNQICLSCHQEQAKQWQSSHHYFSMLPANEKTVLGNFDDQIYQSGQQSVKFFKKNNKFYISVTSKGKPTKTYLVKYTFGYHPLQQYLLVFPNGKLQAFTVAWDTIKNRWFTVVNKEDLLESSPLYWTKRFYNWNHACAECHSTDYSKNPTNKGYKSYFSGVNVNCQACHGPGSEHVTWAKKPSGHSNGLAIQLGKMGYKEKVEICAHCHSRRAQVVPVHEPNKPFQDQYIPALLRPDLYYADGQIKEEVFVYGSFIQSKMYQAGVQCMDCHNPHSLKLILPGNQVCTQCHNDNPVKRFKVLAGKNKNYNSTLHTHHQIDSLGSQCVNCHMSKTTYMKIDPRRDHAFKVPNPELTIKYGIPNACNKCHQDKSAQWALGKVKKWYGRVYQNSPVLIQNDAHLIDIFRNKNQPEIFRASALMLLGVNQQENIQAMISGLDEQSPLIKKAALDKFVQFDPSQLKPYLMPKLEDDNPIIRATTAMLLAGSGLESEAFKKALQTYIDMQKANIDQPESHINLAQLNYKLGKEREAIKFLKKSISIDKHFIPAYIMLSEIYSLKNENAKVIKLLEQGILENPDNATLHFSLGLAYGAEESYQNARKALEKTLELNPNYPRARYNLKIILEKLKTSPDIKATQ